MKNKIQLDANYYFIMLMLGSTCFGHHYAHHQELTTIALVTTFINTLYPHLTEIAESSRLTNTVQKSHWLHCMQSDTWRSTGAKPNVSPAINMQPYTDSRNIALLILALTISWSSVANLTLRPL